MLHVLLCFGHRQPGKHVLFILVFHIEKFWARLSVVHIDFFILKSLKLAIITHHL